MGLKRRGKKKEYFNVGGKHSSMTMFMVPERRKNLFAKALDSLVPVTCSHSIAAVVISKKSNNILVKKVPWPL